MHARPMDDGNNDDDAQRRRKEMKWEEGNRVEDEGKRRWREPRSFLAFSGQSLTTLYEE